MPVPLRIVVVDDHTLFRRGMIALLSQEPGFAVVGEASDGFEGIRTVLAQKPDVVLLDLNMPGISGLEALSAILKEAPGTHVVMLTVSEDAEDLVGALRHGALGYLLKNIESEFLVQSIRRAARGESVVSPELAVKLVREVRDGPVAAARQAVLSPREREILRHIAKGASNKEIARALELAESTVKIHVQHILRKLDLSSRVRRRSGRSGPGPPRGAAPPPRPPGRRRQVTGAQRWSRAERTQSTDGSRPRRSTRLDVRQPPRPGPAAYAFRTMAGPHSGRGARRPSARRRPP
jgi:two-component system nitrate/nitrite response regulator NarL